MKRLWQRGLHLLTGIRRNRKNHLLPLLDKLLLRKRSILEPLLAKLKRGMGLEHSRPRSSINAFVHLFSCLAVYSLSPIKVNMGTSTTSPDLIRNWGWISSFPIRSMVKRL